MGEPQAHSPVPFRDLQAKKQAEKYATIPLKQLVFLKTLTFCLGFQGVLYNAGEGIYLIR